MRIRTTLTVLLTGLAIATAASVAQAQAREEARLLMSSQILEELRTSRDQGIPDWLLQRAYGIAVIPDMTKIAWFFGARRGHGVLIVRDHEGRFTSPMFITMTGGSFGFQWGLQSSDVVLVFTTPKGIEGINGGKVTLGADASVAAGPVGRQASAATDAGLKAEVYSYSRSRGVFAGIALDGSAITIDDGADAAFYRKPGVLAGDIMAGHVRSDDESARRFLAAVSSSTGAARANQRQASAAPTPASPAQPSSNAAKSFPLADPKPGSEPTK